jgi:hypothetical protein
MKPLILTFFVVILCYSLFVRDEETKPESVSKENKTPFYDELQKQQKQRTDSIFLIKYPVAGLIR